MTCPRLFPLLRFTPAWPELCISALFPVSLTDSRDTSPRKEKERFLIKRLICFEGPTAWLCIPKAYPLTSPVGEMGVWLEVGISEFHSSSRSRWIKTTESVCSAGFKCQPEQ